MENCKYKQNEKMLLLGIWVISAIAAIVIFNPLQLYFLNDDFIYIPQSRGGHYLYGTSFRPIADITLLLDFLLYHKQAWGYHVTNLLIHFIATFSVFQLAKRCVVFFKLNVPDYAAHLAALFFLFYAFHSESVFWIIGRGGSLVTVFFAIALKMLLNEKIKSWQLILSMFCFVLGLLTYESIWVLPVITIMVAYYKTKIYKIKKAKVIIEPLLFWAVLLLSFIIKKLVLNDFVGSPYHYSIFSFAALKGLIYNYTTGFFRSFLFPTIPVYFIIGCCVVIFFFLWFLIKGIRKKWFNNIDLFLIIGFLLSLSPIALLAVNTHNSESERFLYLPSVFVCLFLAIHISKIKINWIKAGLIIVLFGYNILFLAQSAKAYKVASQANKTAMQTIGKIKGNYNIVHVINLPTQYKGGFMFRLGFPNALNWMCNNLKYNELIVRSRIEYLKPVTIIPVNTMPIKTDYFINANKINVDPGKDLIIAWDGEKLYAK